MSLFEFFKKENASDKEMVQWDAIVNTINKNAGKASAEFQTDEKALLEKPYEYRTVTFGHFQDMPIEWFVLDKKQDKMLLLSKDIIDTIGCFHDFCFDKKVKWMNSSMEKYLNQSFLYSAFSEAERHMLCFDKK